MIAFGFGELFAGLSHGPLIDRIGSKRATLVNTLIMFLVFAIVLSSIWINKFGVLSFVMAFFWGYNDGIQNTFLMQVMGYEFENSSDPFSVWNVWQGVAEFLV